MPASSSPADRPPPATRLAPSPTGALHLGNARTFLINWALARQLNWRIALRVEDLDTPRNKPGAERDALNTLEWLSIDYDEGPHFQAHDLAPYSGAMRTLASKGLVYPSDLSRTEIEAAASAPQDVAGAPPGLTEIRFPPSLRPAKFPRAFDEPGRSWRFATPDDTVSFVDACAGPQTFRPIDTIGDIAVWTSRGQPAYQLAVVVDDHRQGITHVVRGDDLLESAARQLLLYRSLGLSPEPAYIHLPLVVGPDGRRLAKRHGDTRVAHYRSRGVRPERVIGLLAAWSGVLPRTSPQPMGARTFRERFRLDTMPRERVVFTPEDDAWLLADR